MARVATKPRAKAAKARAPLHLLRRPRRRAKAAKVPARTSGTWAPRPPGRYPRQSKETETRQRCWARRLQAFWFCVDLAPWSSENLKSFGKG